ncbi:hypothetical protein E2C01_009452 [Portunus trituberculatus]|uniref:Uncharacterized protein n=1 Tax=Portunus trituberculatus TaxID=210409 RepID=A0A5B7D5T4_PORTR|nr:hypothetical protein [Portunus trituberculatus]
MTLFLRRRERKYCNLDENKDWVEGKLEGRASGSRDEQGSSATAPHHQGSGRRPGYFYLLGCRRAWRASLPWSASVTLGSRPYLLLETLLLCAHPTVVSSRPSRSCRRQRAEWDMAAPHVLPGSRK